MKEALARRRAVPHDTHRLVVTQSNHLAGSIQDMSLAEKRLVLLAAAVIRQADTELPVIRFDINDYRRIYDVVNNNLVNELLDIVATITTRNIILLHGRSSRASYSVVNTFSIVTGPDSETGRAYGVIELHRDMAQFFLELDGNFFSMPLLVYSAYRSNYALRVGEILASSGRGERHYQVSFSTDDLKERLNCQHYSNFAQFRRRVLEPARRENEEIGYLTFDWEEHKSGRAIDQLTFRVTLKKDVWVAERQRADIQRLALDNRLRQIGFDEIPSDYYDILGHNRVQEIINDVLAQVKERKPTHDPIRKPGAYLRTRLDGEVARLRNGKDGLPVHTDDASLVGERQRLKDSQERFQLSDDLLVQLNQARIAQALGAFENMDAEDQEELTAVVLKDAFSPLPSLMIPQQRPTDGSPLPEKVRRMALVRLLERRGLVDYQDHLADPRQFADHIDFLPNHLPEDREAVIEAALEADGAGEA